MSERRRQRSPWPALEESELNAMRERLEAEARAMEAHAATMKDARLTVIRLARELEDAQVEALDACDAISVAQAERNFSREQARKLADKIRFEYLDEKALAMRNAWPDPAPEEAAEEPFDEVRADELRHDQKDREEAGRPWRESL